jgi:hypothetical protein
VDPDSVSDEIKQRLTELEEWLSELDLDTVAHKKGSKLKDRLVDPDSAVNEIRQRLTELEEWLSELDPDTVAHKKGSKLKDR